MSLHRLVIAITGASGVIYGLRLLQILRTIEHIESHLVVSSAAWLTITQELEPCITRSILEGLADQNYAVKNIGATIASGSYKTHGMIIAPCSMKTLATIAHGVGDNLISRAADVTLKERRRLVLMVRETPLHSMHLRNMLAVTEMGGIIFPPLPAFYQHPLSVDELITDTALRVLSMFDFIEPKIKSWPGLRAFSINRAPTNHVQ